MNEQHPTAEFPVICRGEWESTLLQKEKQNVIDQFYAWFDELVDQGKIKRGQRLTSQGNTIGQKGALIAIDKKDIQVIGSSRFYGYDPERSEIEIGWTFLARSHWGASTTAR